MTQVLKCVHFHQSRIFRLNVEPIVSRIGSRIVLILSDNLVVDPFYSFSHFQDRMSTV
jgi:hypothetical protein